MKFIEGQYYYCDWGNTFSYIFQATSNLKECDHIEIKNKLFYQKSGYFDSAWAKNTRLASQEEIIWFELCKKKGRYVERPIIIFSEEIY